MYILGQLLGYALIAVIIILIVKGVRKYQEKQEKERKEKEHAAQVAAESARIQRQYELEQQKKKEEEAERQKKEAEQAQVAPYVERFLYKDVTLKAAEKVKDAMIRSLSSNFCDRDIRTREIKQSMQINATFSKSVCSSVGSTFNDQHDKGGYYHTVKNITACVVDFKEQNLRPLESWEEMCGFVKAVAAQAEKMFRNQYPKDESGTDYTLQTDESIRHYSSDDKKWTYVSYQFIYTAPNGKYQAPKEW